MQGLLGNTAVPSGRPLRLRAPGVDEAFGDPNAAQRGVSTTGGTTKAMQTKRAASVPARPLPARKRPYGGSTEKIITLSNVKFSESGTQRKLFAEGGGRKRLPKKTPFGLIDVLVPISS